MRRFAISRTSSPAIFFSRDGEFPALHFGEQIAQRRAADLLQRGVAELHGGGVIAQPTAAALTAFDHIDKVIERGSQAWREFGGFFEGGVEAFELEAQGGLGAGGWGLEFFFPSP